MPRKIIYTDHAKDRMEERDISKMKGVSRAAEPMLNYIRSTNYFKSEIFHKINENSDNVYWFKLNGLKTKKNLKAFIYVTKYVEIGTVLVITAYTIDYNDYRNFCQDVYGDDDIDPSKRNIKGS